MGRQYVHLSVDQATAREVGLRKSRHPVIVEVSAAAASRQNVQFYAGNEHVSALNAFTGPKLIVRQLKGLGKFWPTLPNRVYIDKDLARKFERAKCANAFGRRIVEATILHELIHLYDWKGDRRWMRKGIPNSDNGANEFERAAYGEVVIDRYGDWCT